jgi:hypothetical protein
MRVTGAAAAALGVSTAAQSVDAAVGVEINSVRADMRRGSGPSVDALAKLFGITPSDLQAQLGSGKTLAKIAQTYSKTTADVQSTLLGGAAAKLSAAVKAGTITTEQAATLLARARGPIDALVTGASSTIKPMVRGTGTNLLDLLNGSGANSNLFDLMAGSNSSSSDSPALSGGLADYLA